MRRGILVCGLLLGLFGSPVSAHFTMLIPDKPSVGRGAEVVLTLQFGHPFEHELSDMDPPRRLVVHEPGGKVRDLTGQVEKVAREGPKGKPVAAYRVKFRPAARGDYVFVAAGSPRWDGEALEFEEDVAQAVVHVQAQNGWDATQEAEGLHLTPLTRPYGLTPGMVFQALAHDGKKALALAPAEVERYNAAPPGEMPPDEQVTRTMKTDPNGVVTATLPEAGWWAVVVGIRDGKKERDGKEYPVRRRAILWVYVDEKR